MKTLYPWQHAAWQQLIQHPVRNRLPHAWLLTGIKGIGKKQFAHFLAAWLFCANKNEQACGQCKTCLLFNARQHPDFYYLKDDDNEAYNAQNIRLLCNNVLQSAQQGSVKVVLMEVADKLTTAAANALLKTIEEPPAHVYFMLVTERPVTLPVTLRSRCQLVHLPVPEVKPAAQWLIAETQAEESLVNKALQLTYGAPLTALNLLKNPELLTEYQKNANDFLAVVSGKQSALTLAAQWAEADEWHLIEIVQYCLRRIIRNALGVAGQVKGYTQIPVEHWFKLYDEILAGNQRLSLTSGLNRQLFWEHFLLMAQDVTSCHD